MQQSLFLEENSIKYKYIIILKYILMKILSTSANILGLFCLYTVSQVYLVIFKDIFEK